MRQSAAQVKAWQSAKTDALLPIVYVRGFAMNSGEIDDTTADPFNGFNAGSVLTRTGWTGDSIRHVFESPVLRLTQPPFNYRLAFSDGVRGLNAETKQELDDWRRFLEDEANAVGSPPKAVITIYRYYDIDSHLLGDGKSAGMETYGWGLGRLIVDLLEVTKAPGVYIVAHSMGGLVARTFLQNESALDDTHPKLGEKCEPVKALIDARKTQRISAEDWDRARNAVRRFFTYGTPHNGISGQGGWGNQLLGAVGAMTGFDIGNFNRDRMKEYLSLDAAAKDACSLNGKFSVERTFCLVGTGSADYPVAAGFSRRLVGERSDGLVEVDNAQVYGPDPWAPATVVPKPTVLAARAFVRRAHSGPYGMVNSEEGFGNLSRFLFGDIRIDGTLLVRELGLPAALKDMQNETPPRQIAASYNFESYLRVRGESWAMTERLAQNGSAAFRLYDQLMARPFPSSIGMTARQVREWGINQTVDLFNAFLDTELRTDPNRKETVAGGTVVTGSLGFALRLRVAVPDYEVGGTLWRTNHYEGSALLDRDLEFLVFKTGDRWHLAWGDNRPDSSTEHLEIVKPPANPATAQDGDTAFVLARDQALEFWLPIQNGGAPVFRAWLRLRARLASTMA